MSVAPRKSLLRKRAARLAAAQALYSRALNESHGSAETLLKQILSSWQDSRSNDAADLPHATQPDATLAITLITTALEQEETIETAVEALILPGWKKSRMSLPLLSTLRACAAEALAFPDKKRGMLVEEYTEIAAQLVTDEELTFAHKGFNLLLDTLRQDHG